MMIKLLSMAAIGLAALPALQAEPVLREQNLMVMGTELQIVAIGEHAAELDTAIDAAVKEIQRVEDVMTDWRPSPLTRLNEKAGQGPQEVELELAQIIGRGLALGELTHGAFDITFAGVGRLWDFKADPPKVPSQDEIDAALSAVGYERVTVDPETTTVDLPAGMKIGLGGIAKGYGVDRAMKTLMDHGVKNGMVNAGGDMKVLGTRFGQPWEVAVKHPRDRQRAMAAIKLSNACLVTSGDYERFFEYEGKRYHHILDPRTGYPSEGCLSASVVAPNAEYADALATALCVMGPEDGLSLVGTLDRVDAILVGMDGKVHVSPGLQDAVLETD